MRRRQDRRGMGQQMAGGREGEGGRERDRGVGGEGQAGETERQRDIENMEGPGGDMEEVEGLWEMEETGLVGQEVVG